MHSRNETGRGRGNDRRHRPFSKDIFKRCREGEHLYQHLRQPCSIASSSFPSLFIFVSTHFHFVRGPLITRNLNKRKRKRSLVTIPISGIMNGKRKKEGRIAFTRQNSRIVSRINESRCVINRKEMAREDIVPTFKRFSNRVIIFFFSFFSYSRSGDLLPWLRCWKRNDRPMEFHVREREDGSVFFFSFFFFFFFFLHVSFIQSQANKAQSLQRIIERSRSKYLSARIT